MIRSAGQTPSERYLKRLCDRSFLTLWSYPNLHLDKAGGQELCDLLVVFGEHVVIFSDKSCHFPNTGDLQVDWSRWYRRSVEKSADQVFGAERWIRSHANRIFLDRKCTHRFPLDLPSGQDAKFHRVVVALGAADRCRAEFGGSGSLMLSPKDGSNPKPFTIGDVAPSRGYVHVLDDITLDIVLQELDTIAAFTAYLTAKERFVRSGRLLGAAGEEDLLALYLRHVGPTGEHEFIVPRGADAVVVDETHWAALQTSPRYLSRKKADEISYLWDELIECFNKNIAAGTLAHGSELGVQRHEEAMRIMAGETRLARRMLGASIMEKIRTTPSDGESVRVMASMQRPDVGYVFILDPRGEDEEHESYRRRRLVKLEAYCRVAKHVRPGLLHIVGVATEPVGGGRGRSEDLVHLDATNLTREDQQLAGELHEKGLLKNTLRFEGIAHEFPKVSDPPRSDPDVARRARNKKKSERRKRG